MSAKLSVIIPVYNVELYLEKCIRSVINQSYRDLEIILVDDGATDSSGMICDRYAEVDSRIRVLHTSNGGLSVARNNGLKIAKGEYITFVDSDDYLLSDTIYEDCIKILYSDQRLECIQFSYHRVGIDGNILNTHTCEATEYFGRNIFFEKLENVSGSCAFSIQDPVWNKLYRKRAIGDILFRPGVKFEDAIFTMDVLMSLRGGIKLIPNIGYAYVENPNSIMGEKLTLSKATDAINSNLHVFEQAVELINGINRQICSDYLCKIFYEIHCLSKLNGLQFDKNIFRRIDSYAHGFGSILKCSGIRNKVIMTLLKFFGGEKSLKIMN